MKNSLFVLLVILSLLSCDSNSANNDIGAPTDNLVAYYPFNMNIFDESGNNHHGSENYGAISIFDRFDNQNSAFYFDDDDYIKLTKPEWIFEEYGDTDEYSYSIWFLPFSENFYTIFCDSGGSSKTVKMYDTSEYQLTVIVTCYLNDDYNTLWLFYNIEDYFQWYNITVTVSSSTQEINLYANGDLIETESNIGELLIPEDSWLIAGSRGHNGTNDDNFHGIIDDIRIYDRALTIDEVKAIYHENGWD